MNNSYKKNVLNFIKSCEDDSGQFKLTSTSEITEFGLPFYIFILNLFDEKDTINKNLEQYNISLRSNIKKIYINRSKNNLGLIYDKYFLQLLSFTLSALKVIGTIDNDPLEEFTLNLYQGINCEKYLENIGAFEGKPGSGNLAMFYAINKIHNQIYLNHDCKKDLNNWIGLHLKKMNKNGFWGDDKSSPYLQFQNGYHQYEIFNFLGKGGIFWEKATKLVTKLCDSNGRFAPYPGGGGCYDYDAIFFLTSKYKSLNIDFEEELNKTTQSILNSINKDGGSAESLNVRPRTLNNLYEITNHIFQKKRYGFKSRLITNLKLLLPKHDKLKTHWPSRQWDQSNLWDTWFRHLTIYRICEAYPKLISKKLLGYSDNGFINYPGIGFN